VAAVAGAVRVLALPMQMALTLPLTASPGVLLPRAERTPCAAGAA
jgi:hypothetical protein